MGVLKIKKWVFQKLKKKLQFTAGASELGRGVEIDVHLM
jgi:hypothetical protein